MAARRIETEAATKGGLVAGHDVYLIFPSIPAVPAKIAAVSKSGHSVTVEVDAILARLAQMRRRWTFTWRAASGSYQPKGARTKAGVGLVLVRRRA